LELLLQGTTGPPRLAVLGAGCTETRQRTELVLGFLVAPVSKIHANPPWVSLMTNLEDQEGISQ
jgi:hypothetical protein